MKDLETPAMKQYYKAKQEYPDSLIFFRMGDFYESFDEDAKVISKELDITLTNRGKNRNGKKMPLAGIPYHSIDLYLPRLIKKGYKVAICEQLEDPKKAKGIVKRGVIRVITPGTAIDSSIITTSSNNYLMIIVSNFNICSNLNEIIFGISFLDISTGEFLTTQFKDNKPYEKLISEIENMSPSECLIDKNLIENSILYNRINKYDFLITYIDITNNINSELNKSKEFIKLQFVNDYDNIFSILNDKIYSLIACGNALNYIIKTQQKSLLYIKTITYYHSYSTMMLDSITLNNLEIFKNIRNNNNTLYNILNKTKTSNGSRILKKWISRPLLNINDINERLNTVDYLYHNSILIYDINNYLTQIYDIERIISRLVYGIAHARDLLSLKKSLVSIKNIYHIILSHTTKVRLFKNICYKIEKYNLFNDIIELIEKSIEENPPITIREGHIIKNGYNKNVDELRYISSHTLEWMNNYQKKERDKTGIKSLKVGYNKIYGYYIEVTNPNINQVPSHYIRRQTMSNCERYFTEELKKQEEIILSSEEKLNILEYDLFISIVQEICKKYSILQDISELIGSLDVLVNFAYISKENNYIKPILNDSDTGNIIIKDGRHPIIEKSIENNFIENDVNINNKNEQLLLITGPNMAGKSTYMRQIAMIIIMCQSGCFVPASYAEICIVDKIFTRIGAHDDLSSGKSTFMIEMLELSNILNNCTKKSLVLLDEVGRGTSTYDGYSISRATIEYLHSKGIRTLFATHYYQLTKLCNIFPKIKNYYVSVKEEKDKLLFLRKITSGYTNNSYGIQVAKMAGVPNIVINRSFELKKIILEKEKEKEKISIYNNNILELLNEIKNIDIDNMKPISALFKLFEFKNRLFNIEKNYNKK